MEQQQPRPLLAEQQQPAMINIRTTIQRLVSHLPYDVIPEMMPPPRTVMTRPPPGYLRELDMYPDTPYFNASSYCNRLNIRFAVWLRHPATIALLKAYSNYYREAARESPPSLIMIVKGGARIVHGYYVHMTLHDALSSWCDFELVNPSNRPRIPPRQASSAVLYTTQTIIDPGTPAELIEAAQANSRARIANVISAARGGTFC